MSSIVPSLISSGGIVVRLVCVWSYGWKGAWYSFFESCGWQPDELFRFYVCTSASWLQAIVTKVRGHMKSRKETKAFKKVKVKVGKKVKKTLQTNTAIKTRKIVFGEQLTESRSCSTSYRGLSLDDLCRQLGHYNRNIRRDALIGVKQLLSANPHLISSSLYILIPSVARLVVDETSDGLFRAQLKSLINLLFQTPPDVMCSHYEILLAHILLALTHLKFTVRAFGVTIVLLLMHRYPRLCSDRSDLFYALTDVLSSFRRLPKKHLLSGIVLAILDVYFIREEKNSGPRYTATFCARMRNYSLVDLTAKPVDFQYSILGSNGVQETSPFRTQEGVLRFCTAVFPILESFLYEENHSYDELCAEVTEKIGQIVRKLREVDESASFQKQYMSTISSYISLVGKREGPARLKEAAKSLVQKY